MKTHLKHTILLISVLYFSISMNGQYLRTKIKGKSPTKKISYRTSNIEDKKDLKPKLEIIDYGFVDENGNQVIERNEKGNIEIQLANEGQGTAKDISVTVSLISSEIEGLYYKNEIFLGNIYAENTREIIIPVHGKSYLNTGIAQFEIEINERFGHHVKPIIIKMGTHLYHQPKVNIAEAVFSTDDGNDIRFGYPVYLKLVLENTSSKTIKNLEAEISFENQGCILLSDNKFFISSLEANETIAKEVAFTAKMNYPYDAIPINLLVQDKYKMYSEVKRILLDLNQHMTMRNLFENSNTYNDIPTIIADVDTSIPVDTLIYKERYALILGNENYKRHQPLLTDESNVIYAKNDASVFKKYAINTLGTPEENVFFLLDATYAEMQVEVERVSKILEKTGNNSELIFYYAGHGFPDENSRVPYLIPVDVSAANLQSAIKLSDIYKRFSLTGSKRITMFIDACFTGGGRESGLMAARAFKVEPKYETLSGNIVVFNSSSGSQSSLPYHDKNHGIFTYFLLKKLKETKGYISYGQLSNYLEKEVSIESLRINAKEQDPKVNISADVKETWEDWSLKPVTE